MPQSSFSANFKQRTASKTNCLTLADVRLECFHTTSRSRPQVVAHTIECGQLRCTQLRQKDWQKWSDLCMPTWQLSWDNVKCLGDMHFFHSALFTFDVDLSIRRAHDIKKYTRCCSLQLARALSKSWRYEMVWLRHGRRRSHMLRSRCIRIRSKVERYSLPRRGPWKVADVSGVNGQRSHLACAENNPDWILLPRPAKFPSLFLEN